MSWSLICQDFSGILLEDEAGDGIYAQYKSSVLGEESEECLVQMDVAENFTCMSQDKIQSAQWRQPDIPLYSNDLQWQEHCHGFYSVQCQRPQTESCYHVHQHRWLN